MAQQEKEKMQAGSLITLKYLFNRVIVCASVPRRVHKISQYTKYHMVILILKMIIIFFFIIRQGPRIGE